MEHPLIVWRPKAALALAAFGLAIAGAAVATVTPANGASRTGAAAPGSDATIEAKGFAVARGKVDNESVTCPTGKRAVGGGVGFAGQTSPSFGYVQQGGPVDETGSITSTESGDVARGWSVSVFNNSGSAGSDFRVFAVCSASSDATIVANPFTVQPRSVSGASVDCPSGKRALGGGVDQPGATNPLFGWVRSSGPVDGTGTTANTDSGDVPEGWYASVYNFGGATRDFHVFAICSADSDATIAAKVFSVAPGHVGDATVDCRAGQRIVGGGVGQQVATNAPAGYVQESAPVDVTGEPANTDSGEVGRSWFTSVYNPPEAGSPTREFRAFAICAGEATTTSTPTTTASPAKSNVFCSALRATIVGTPGRDVLTGTPGRDVIAGLGGNDLINGLGGNDVICGGDGADKLIGGAGDDAIYGGAGNDYITAGSGNDRVGGDSGNDRIFGGAGNDSLYGGTGNDLIHGGPGVDRIDGGAGRNTVKP
ncbi:MAG TPA: calcium-binding protein [Gaiellaceae bacterium]|nr:calcium-binding protein [Gaiellaceae bacterium]